MILIRSIIVLLCVASGVGCAAGDKPTPQPLPLESEVRREVTIEIRSITPGIHSVRSVEDAWMTSWVYWLTAEEYPIFEPLIESELEFGFCAAVLNIQNHWDRDLLIGDMSLERLLTSGIEYTDANGIQWYFESLVLHVQEFGVGFTIPLLARDSKQVRIKMWMCAFRPAAGKAKDSESIPFDGLSYAIKSERRTIEARAVEGQALGLPIEIKATAAGECSVTWDLYP